ncbi:MAG: esterase-like activity of phytase family protein, partial [Alphaproteobacteria bacterium]
LRILVLLLLVAMLTTGARARKLEITTHTVPLNYTAPEQDRIGRLIWRGGIEISASYKKFGGFSGLLISADGTSLTAVSDSGFWVTANITHDADGFLTGLADAQYRRLRGTNGKTVKGKIDQDAEAMTEMADGSIVVAYERNHRIWRYPPRDTPLRGKAEPLPAPIGLDELKKNGGIEALVTLADDSVLALVEGKDDEAVGTAFLWRGGVWQPLRYQRYGSYRPSGAARLPNGDLLVLERRFTLLEGVGIRLVRVPAETVVAGALLQPVEVARLLPPLTIDNMEAVDVHQNERGETLVYLLSDDNFSIIQRTLLLMFAFEE